MTDRDRDTDENLILERLRTGGGLEMASLAAASDAPIPEALGDYRILGLLADGGMGQVFRAERADGRFDREVAIKMPIGSIVNASARQRFLREQRILAEMQHPNICQLFDAGITDGNQPFIVMELVAGDTLPKHCQNQGLSLRARLELFAQVVDAVAFAHSRLVIHRDLKPSNTLVDENGNPKLLDFGIAKSLGADEEETRTAAHLLTPRYASPEQLLGGTVTVASDLFQLGLLLYETLLGEPPDDAPLEERIRRFSTGHEVDFPAASRELPREITAIIRQCTRLDPAARYASASTLRNDLDAYLRDEPVRALNTGKLYALGKFFVRNRASASIALLAVGAIVLTTLLQLDRLAEERDLAQRQSLLAEESLQVLASFFNRANPFFSQGEEMTARQILEFGESRLDERLNDQPEVQARLYYELAATFSNLGNATAAARIAQKAIDVSEANGLTQSRHYFWAINVRANVFADTGEFDKAIALFRPAIALARQELGDDSRVIEALEGNLAAALLDAGRYPEAREILEAALPPMGAGSDAWSTNALYAAANLARMLQQTGDLPAAIARAERAIAIVQEQRGDKHPLLLDLFDSLGMAYFHDGNPQAAYDALEAGLNLTAELRGEADVFFTISNADVALALFELGDGPAAMARLNRSISEARAEDSPLDEQLRWYVERSYARGLRFTNRSEQALPILVEAVDVLTDLVGYDHFDTLLARREMAELLDELGDPAAAAAQWQALRESVVAQYGDGHWLLRTRARPNSGP